MKVFIVDHHPSHRECLMRLCARSNDLEVVGWSADGRSAIDAAGSAQPDLLLLDVDLPDISGFELLRFVGAGVRPLGILVSASAEHASRALAEGALDHFVMPVTAARFEQGMSRARRLQVARSAPRYLVGERQRKLYPLDPRCIDYIEADGNYVTLRVGTVEYLSRDSLKHLASQLQGLCFVRIARSLLVNAAAVQYAEAAGHGTFALTLNSGVCLYSTAAFRDALLEVIPLPAMSRRAADSRL